MKDPFNLEPRNGDFATYVENLQKAELEKLRRANPAAAEQAAQSIRGGGDSLSLRDLIERSKEVFGAKKAESEKVRETVFGPVTQTDAQPLLEEGPPAPLGPRRPTDGIR